MSSYRIKEFFVEFQGVKSRWRTQKNGLPKGNVLAPTLFNIYTNDQNLLQGTESFIYAHDRAITFSSKHFEDVEENLTKALRELTAYYRNNQLKPNPSET